MLWDDDDAREAANYATYGAMPVAPSNSSITQYRTSPKRQIRARRLDSLTTRVEASTEGDKHNKQLVTRRHQLQLQRH